MEPIEETYFNWLFSKVSDGVTRNYYGLLQILHETEFVWVVPFDRNRADDGIELREEFLRETGTEPNPLWLEEPCSVFEALLAFSDRASFQTDIPIKDWFHEFLTNLRLDPYRVVSESDLPQIHDILNTFIWRTYGPDGDGGLFPLRRSPNDQREVELWYQLFEYLEDRGLM